ncbi:MAG TPA: sigma factor-like helix-turn-helix DNA-binding protein [Alphaproteobacteria bacterium]
MKPVSHHIIRWLPHLRRHAHALTGSRERGDSYVMACLSVLVSEPDRVRPDSDVRLGLFKLFHTIWRMVDREYPLTGADPAVDELALCQGLAELPPLSRQILLLTAMEEFSVAETASITGVPTDTVAQALDSARAQVRGRFEYLIPLDFYRQARPRRSVARPSPRQTASRARTAQAPLSEKRPVIRPGSWTS